jgi:hypothetical protein
MLHLDDPPAHGTTTLAEVGRVVGRDPPRTVALRAPNGWSQDLQRTVGNSHLPGSLLAGTIRC